MKGRAAVPSKPPLTPEQRSDRARLAAQVRWAYEDPRAGTEKARAALWERYLDQVDPDRSLPEDERARRAESARRADMTRLALAASRARSRRAAQ